MCVNSAFFSYDRSISDEVPSVNKTEIDNIRKRCLLAVALVSMSSPDQGIQRLTFDTLLRYKNALEKCQERKDVMRLRLLINSIQNSIEESWKRIPSVIALFAAEAPCVLLYSSHDHYAAINTFLIQSSKLNMKILCQRT